jgi:hypothetical protein
MVDAQRAKELVFSSCFDSKHHKLSLLSVMKLKTVFLPFLSIKFITDSTIIAAVSKEIEF